MKRVTKALIVSGELLITASLGLMTTGLAMNDPASALGSLMDYETARRVHTIASYLFIPLFYVHTAAGIYIALGRFGSLRKPEMRKAAVTGWTFLISALLLMAFAPQEGIPSGSEVSAAVILTPEEVAKHNTETDCWVVVKNKVYNVTALIDQHPGGREAILKYCGTNATDVFFREHSQNDYELLQAYYIGTIGGALQNSSS
ncbi:cytochrome b5 domain-containing protein [Thermococcus argininiproducens]|uniref:Cytochrome b5 domain-containing protein n=1 Tax=Thermococcus argininiproducens TaxID=2866384 RepID=A0A9E7SD45_9EURY|nr:cytochrome b5-like heme/steroid binding domain-containing protein [Thermococcus argininiproducens]USH00162.1 cytochrome b5 domain-containing protein [Thermococcus argininiproducens]